MSPDWLVSPPEVGFLFPAFDERATNLYNALYYTKNIGENHSGFVDAVFRAPAPMPAAVQKESFQSVLGDTLAEDCSFLGFCLEGFIGLGSTKRLTDDGLTIEADKGIKCRSANMVTFRYILEDLHYNPVAVAYNEVPTAIQTNVVDGWVGGTPNMNYAWVGDVINYMYVNYIHPEATSYVASQKTLDKLTEEDRAIVIECFEQASADSFVKAEENEKVFIQKLQDDYGVEVIEYTPEQIAPIAEYVRDVTWTRLEADLGSDFINACRADVEAKGY